MTDAPHNDAGGLVEPLTRREREVLGLLAQGLTAPEIAERLTLAVSSVKWHIQQLYAKLGVNGKKQAIGRAEDLGLLSQLVPSTAPSAHPASPPSRIHNLPLQVTRFFGREMEIAQLRARLGEHRLVTLAGSGGVGKTRLSLQVAETLLASFRHGVWLVELAPLTDPALVGHQLAAVLELNDQPGRSIQDTLTAYLRERSVLLVLDNCEHVLEECARLTEGLLRTCPQLRILASSREPLGVTREAIFAVPSLAFPAPEQAVAPTELEVYAAVRLFIDRARLVRPDYELAGHNAAPIVRICQRLDGVPLAIEMAAARINVLTAEQLAGRLEDVFQVLTGGSRTALPRQQTLRATIDWSYQLLSETERLLLQRLSVFAGGCTLAAAEAVCAGEGLVTGQVLNTLAALVGKSMVVVDRQPGEEPRYRLLETVRQYAREKLQEHGEAMRLHTRHRDYYLTLAEGYKWGPNTTANMRAQHALQPELDNLRLALEWSFSNRSDTNVEAALRVVNYLRDIWPSYRETVAWFKRAKAFWENHPGVSLALQAELLTWGSNPLAQDEPQLALAWAQQAVEISRRLGPAHQELLIISLFWLGQRYGTALSDLEPAEAHTAEAEALFLELSPEQFTPDMYQTIKAALFGAKADRAVTYGRFQEAKQLATESIQLWQALGNLYGLWLCRLTLAEACRALGEYDQAREHLETALELSKHQVGEKRLRSYALRWLGELDLLQGNLARALAHGHEGLALAAQIPDYNIIATNLMLCAGVHAQRNQRLTAARLAGAAKALYARQGRETIEDTSLDTLLPGWRESPDQSAISQAFEAGQAMSGEQAVAHALSDEVADVEAG